MIDTLILVQGKEIKFAKWSKEIINSSFHRTRVSFAFMIKVIGMVNRELNVNNLWTIRVKI